MKRSNVVFLAIAVVVAIGAVVFYMNYPPVDQRDAQGSIGAVQKYRTEQISKAGVVLADENSRREEAETYGEYLEQATQLQSVTASLAGFTAMLNAKDASFANREASLANLNKMLDGRIQSLDQRMLALTANLAARQEMQGFKAEFQGIQAMLNAKTLDAKTLDAVASRLDAITQQMGVRIYSREMLQSKQLFESKQMMESKEMLQAREMYQSKELFQAQAQLAAVGKQLEAKTLGDKELEAIDRQLAAVNEALAVNAQMGSNSLASQLQQLNAKVVEARTLYQVRENLAAVERSLNAKGDLGVSASMLENVIAQLGVQAASMENRAMLNMQNRLDSRTLEARTLYSMKAMAESISRELAARTVESKILLNVQANLASVEKSLEGRTTQLSQKVLYGSRAEMAAITNHLDSREQFASVERSLQAKTLDARNTANLDSFQAYLQNLDKSLAVQPNLSAVERAEIGAQTKLLQSRIEQ